VPGNVRFSVAVHLLVYLAMADGPVSSGTLAASVSTNPVVIRRILGRLRRKGLVAARPGPRGGFVLARAPASVTLESVHRAVEEGGAAPPAHRPSRRCPVGRHVAEVIDGIGCDAEGAFLRALARRTLAGAVAEVRRRARKPRR
jgi:Rrf2 family protein